MNIKDPVEEKSELVIDALQYAHTHNLDINNKNDIVKILEALDASSEDVAEFMDLLQNADVFMEVNAKEKEPEKTDLPN